MWGFLRSDGLVKFKLLSFVGEYLFIFQSFCYAVWGLPFAYATQVSGGLGSGLYTCSVHKTFDSLLWLCFTYVQFRDESETCIDSHTEVNYLPQLSSPGFLHSLELQGTLFLVLLDRNTVFSDGVPLNCNIVPCDKAPLWRKQWKERGGGGEESPSLTRSLHNKDIFY